MSDSARPFTHPITLTGLVVALLAFIGAVVVGIGGPVGFHFLQVTAVALLVAIVHRWREPRAFLKLAGGSVAVFAACVLLHNGFYALGLLAKSLPVLPSVLEVLHVTAFLIAVAACPVGVTVGIVGAITTAVAKRARRTA